jgi:hypothetical protein
MVQIIIIIIIIADDAHDDRSRVSPAGSGAAGYQHGVMHIHDGVSSPDIGVPTCSAALALDALLEPTVAAPIPFSSYSDQRGFYRSHVSATRWSPHVRPQAVRVLRYAAPVADSLW